MDLTMLTDAFVKFYGDPYDLPNLLIITQDFVIFWFTNDEMIVKIR
jgi:hypothetical protein